MPLCLTDIIAAHYFEIDQLAVSPDDREALVSCPRSSFNNFSDSGLFVLSGAKDLYVPNYQTVGAIFARWLSIKTTATATFLETFFCKELLGHDTSSLRE